MKRAAGRNMWMPKPPLPFGKRLSPSWFQGYTIYPKTALFMLIYDKMVHGTSRPLRDAQLEFAD